MSPKADLLITRIGELVTFRHGPLARVDEKAAGVIWDAAVAVREGRIIAAGPRSEIEHRFKAYEEFDAEGGMVTPAFTDAHTHLIFAGSREDELELKLMGYTYAQILERGGGIHRTIRMTQEASVEDLVSQALPIARLMLLSGTTTVETKSGYAVNLEGEVKMLQAAMEMERLLPLRTVRTLLAHVVPRDFPGDRSEYVSYFQREVIPRVAATRGLAKYFDVFCDRGAFTLEETRRLVETALEYGFRIRLHADQLEYMGCSRLAREYPIDSLDHLDRMPPENARLLADRGTAAVLLPTSMVSMRDFDATPPIEEMRRAGVIMALASDYNPNNQTPRMEMALDLATYLYGLTPLEALAAATVNAAYSLRIHDNAGSIREGAAANLVIWDVDSHRWIGYGWGLPKVAMVVVEGRLLQGP